MTILIDVDGVLANFSGHVIRTAGVDMTIDDVTQWDLFSLMGDAGVEAKKRLKDPDWWLGIAPMPGAQDAIDRLRHDGRELIAVTSPWISCKGWGWARREWLKACFGIRHNEVIITSAKHLVRGSMIIDDKPETVRKWSAYNPTLPALLFDAPYNRNDDWPGRITSLETLCQDRQS